MFKVRVCDGCYAALQKPSSGTLKRNEGPNDLPAEYLNSSLAQQSQVSIMVNLQWRNLSTRNSSINIFLSGAFYIRGFYIRRHYQRKKKFLIF